MMMVFASKPSHDQSTKHKHCPPNCVLHNNFSCSLRKYSRPSLSKVRSSQKVRTVLKDKQNLTKKTSASNIQKFRPSEEEQKTQKKSINHYKSYDSPVKKSRRDTSPGKLVKSKQKGEIQTLLMRVSLQKRKGNPIQKSNPFFIYSTVKRQVDAYTLIQKHILNIQINQQISEISEKSSKRQKIDQDNLNHSHMDHNHGNRNDANHDNGNGNAHNTHENDEILNHSTESNEQLCIVKTEQLNSLQKQVDKITNIIEKFNKRITNSSQQQLLKQEQKKENQNINSQICANQTPQKSAQISVEQFDVSFSQKQNQFIDNQIPNEDNQQKQYKSIKQVQLSFNNISPVGELQPDLKMDQKKQILLPNPYQVSPSQHPRYKIIASERVVKQMSKQQSTNNQKTDQGKLNYKMFNLGSKPVSAFSSVSGSRRSNKNKKKCHGVKLIV